MIWFMFADLVAYSCIYVGMVMAGTHIAEKFRD